MKIVRPTLPFSSCGVVEAEAAAEVGFHAFKTGVDGIESREARDRGRLGVRAGDEAVEGLEEPRTASRASEWF